MTSSTHGRHLVAEYFGCSAQTLDDVDAVRRLLEQAATTAGAHVVQTVTHQFSPQGVSVVVMLEESHISIHSWPEEGYAAVDFYTCGDCSPELAHAVLGSGLEAGRSELMMLHRGRIDADRSLQVAEHRTEVLPTTPASLKETA